MAGEWENVRRVALRGVSLQLKTWAMGMGRMAREHFAFNGITYQPVNTVWSFHSGGMRAGSPACGIRIYRGEVSRGLRRKSSVPWNKCKVSAENACGTLKGCGVPSPNFGASPMPLERHCCAQRLT